MSLIGDDTLNELVVYLCDTDLPLSQTRHKDGLLPYLIPASPAKTRVVKVVTKDTDGNTGEAMIAQVAIRYRIQAG